MMAHTYPMPPSGTDLPHPSTLFQQPQQQYHAQYPAQYPAVGQQQQYPPVGLSGCAPSSGDGNLAMCPTAGPAGITCCSLVPMGLSPLGPSPSSWSSASSGSSYPLTPAPSAAVDYSTPRYPGSFSSMNSCADLSCPTGFGGNTPACYGSQSYGAAGAPACYSTQCYGTAGTPAFYGSPGGGQGYSTTGPCPSLSSYPNVTGASAAPSNSGYQPAHPEPQAAGFAVLPSSTGAYGFPPPLAAQPGFGGAPVQCPLMTADPPKKSKIKMSSVAKLAGKFAGAVIVGMLE